MSLLTQLSRSAHQFQQNLHLHLPWQEVDASSEPPTGGFVVVVAVFSVAAAALLVLAP